MTLHVFYIHSQSCYITSLKVIKYKKIDFEDVLFLTVREIPNFENRIRHFQIPSILDNWPFYTHSQIFNLKWIFGNKRVISIIDNFIEEIINSDFIFYSQNGRHYKYNLFISSIRCIENHYIEDGLDMYSTYKQFDIKYPSPLKLRYFFFNRFFSKLQRTNKRIFQKNDPFWNKTESTKCYGLNNLSFKKILKNKTQIECLGHINLNYEIDELEKIPILLPSALEEQKICTNINLINTYISYLKKKKYSKVYLKWHPGHSENSKSVIKSTLNIEGIKTLIIPNDLMMELYFTTTKNNHEIISIGSGLLIYAAILSKTCKPVALYKLLEKNSKKTPRSEYWQETFSDFKNIVTIEE